MENKTSRFYAVKNYISSRLNPKNIFLTTLMAGILICPSYLNNSSKTVDKNSVESNSVVNFQDDQRTNERTYRVVHPIPDSNINDPNEIEWIKRTFPERKPNLEDAVAEESFFAPIESFYIVATLWLGSECPYSLDDGSIDCPRN